MGDAFRALPGLKYCRGKELRMSQRGRGWQCGRVKVCACILLRTGILSLPQVWYLKRLFQIKVSNGVYSMKHNQLE